MSSNTQGEMMPNTQQRQVFEEQRQWPGLMDEDAIQAWYALPTWTVYEAIALFTDSRMPPYFTVDPLGYSQLGDSPSALLDWVSRLRKRVDVDSPNELLFIANSDSDCETLRQSILLAKEASELILTLDRAYDLWVAKPETWVNWMGAHKRFGIPSPDEAAAANQAGSGIENTSQGRAEPSCHTQAIVEMDDQDNFLITTKTRGKKDGVASFRSRKGHLTKQSRLMLMLSDAWPGTVSVQQLITELYPGEAKSVKPLCTLVGDTRNRLLINGIDGSIISELNHKVIDTNKANSWVRLCVAKLERHGILKNSKETIKLIGENPRNRDYLDSIDGAEAEEPTW